MAPLVLDIVGDNQGHIVVDDQGQPVRRGPAQPVGKDMPAGSSTLSPAEAVPLQEVVQQTTRPCHVVQSLNAMTAQASSQLQRLMEPVASRIQQTIVTQVQTAFRTERTRVQALLASQANALRAD
jgi:hypothetical protein